MNKTKTAIIGFGITGQSVARYLLGENHQITVFDSKTKSEFEPDLLNNFKEIDFIFSTNDFSESDFDLIVVSPGVHFDLPVLKRAKAKNIPIKNDVSMFIEKWREAGPIIGVTGSNGKTTIVNLIFNYLKGIGVPAILGGNVGNSPLDDLAKKQSGMIAVLELSSYQLDYFQPEHYLDICLISNLSSNHLDRYQGKMQDYALAKMKGINKHKTKVVLCFDDSGTKKYILPKLKAKDFSLVSLETNVAEALSDGVFSDEAGNLILRKDQTQKTIFTDVENRKIIGLHNLYNIAMSYAVLDYLKVDLSHDQPFREFQGLEYRIQFVDEIDEVKYVNDSKSTSPDSVRVAINALTKTKNIILILGGKDKGMSYDLLVPEVEQFVKKIVLVPGDCNDKIRKTFVDLEIEIVEAVDLEDALNVSKKSAVVGDVVLFSPGAASPQPYRNFEERGAHFTELVSKLL